MKDILDSSAILVSLQINAVNTTGLKDITAEIQYSTGSFRSIRSDAMDLKEQLTPQRLSDSYYCDIDAHVRQHPGGQDWIYEGYTLTIKTQTTEENIPSTVNYVIHNQ